MQVLCFNCNLGKSINNGICPHLQINKKLEPCYDKRHDPQFDKRLKIVWPNDEDLIRMCNESSVSQVAKELDVNFSAVSGRLKRRDKYHLVSKKSGGIKKGANNAAAKLTEKDVIYIRFKCQEGTKRKYLAEQFKVSLSLIDKIVTYKVWGHVK